MGSNKFDSAHSKPNLHPVLAPHSEPKPPDLSRGIFRFVPAGDSNKPSLRLKARGFNHPRRGY